MAARKQTTAVTNWDEELAKQADVAAGAVRSGGGNGRFFSMRAGQLSFDGNPLPGNQMAVVILASVMENSYYDTDFDPDTPASPKCFAFGKDEADMEPHDAVDNDDYFERQSAGCEGCPQNEWGSARKGKGKACANVMRLAMIPAGVYKQLGGRNAGLDLELFDDPEHFAKAEVAFMKIPVMSVKNYSAYVKSLAADLRRPPHGVVTNVFLTPSERSQFVVNFEVVDKLGGALLSEVVPRHAKEQETIGFPYTPPMVDEKPKAAATNNKLRRPGAKR
jgi:hypothetical protein